MKVGERLQIGEVAEAVGLSIRTIRHYDEVGVVQPSGRSAGGFRLYTGADVERLRFVKRLKPLEFSLEEIQELLRLRDAARSGDQDEQGRERLAVFASLADERCAALREQLAAAEEVAGELRRSLGRRSSRRGR